MDKGEKMANEVKWMLNELERITNIYDFLALCSVYIFDKLKKINYEFANFEDNNYYEIEVAIERYVIEKLNKGEKYAFNELKIFVIQYWQYGVDIERCYAFVKYIDEKVELELKESLFDGNGIIKYSSMNKEYTDRVRILPKLNDTMMLRGQAKFKNETNSYQSFFRKRRECAVSKLDEETVNYMIWDKPTIEKYPLSIYRLMERHSVTKHFYDREKMIFGIIPFTNKALESILDIKFERRTFTVERMFASMEQELEVRYKKVYDKCKMNDVDFLIFPEMLMTENIIKTLQREYSNESPWIIVNGSIWKDYTNRSIITDSGGQFIFDYCKKTPFIFQQNGIEYKEYLKCKNNKEYTMLEIEGIGRIGIAICKDLINEDIKMFHKYMNTDILIVPAYTKSMDLSSAAEELSADYQCVVVVVNACSAIGNKSQIGFITLPAKGETNRDKIIQYYYKKEDCLENCNSECSGKKFIIDFGKVKQYGSLNSYMLEEECI